jgi:hypothetical protein
MYTAIRRYTTAPGRAKGIAQKADASFLPIVRAIPGFVAYFLVDGGQDAGRDVLATVSIFETKEQADESVRRAALWVRENALPSDDMRGPEVTAGTALVASVRTGTPSYSDAVARSSVSDESRT